MGGTLGGVAPLRGEVRGVRVLTGHATPFQGGKLVARTVSVEGRWRTGAEGGREVGGWEGAR